MRPEASEQIKIFKEHVTNIQFSTDEYAYLISMKWLQKWYKSVGYYNNSNPTNDCPPIDNKNLINEGENRRVLMEGIDHFVVKKDMWDLFVKWYGGGPEIKVEVGFDPIRKQNIPDVHPLTLHIFYSLSTIRKHLINSNHDNQHSNNNRDINFITMQFSKYKTADMLRNIICEKLQLSPSKFSIFMLTSINEHIDMSSTSKNHGNDSLKKATRKKLEGARTLSEYHISNNQQLILDVDNEIARNMSLYKTNPEGRHHIQPDKENQNVRTGILKASPINFNSSDSQHKSSKASNGSQNNSSDLSPKVDINSSNDEQNVNLKMSESSKSALLPSSASMMFVKGSKTTFNLPTSTSMSFVQSSILKGDHNDENENDNEDEQKGISTFQLNEDNSSNSGSEIIHHYDGSRSRLANLAASGNPDTSNFNTFAGSNHINASKNQKNSAYLVHGPSQQIGLCGFVNLGNTCFFNSSLQALLHTMPLINHFLNDNWKSEMSLTNKLGTKGACVTAFVSIAERVWAGLATSLAPRHLFGVIQRYAPHFSGFNQQDAHELLLFLLDMIHEDLNRVKAREEIIEREKLKELQMKKNEQIHKSPKRSHKSHKHGHKKKNESNSDSNDNQNNDNLENEKTKKKKQKHNKNQNNSDENSDKRNSTPKKKHKVELKSSNSENSNENEDQEEKKNNKQKNKKNSKLKEQESTSSDDNENDDQNSTKLKNKSDSDDENNSNKTDKSPAKKKEHKKKEHENKSDKKSDSENDSSNKTDKNSVKKKEHKKKEHDNIKDTDQNNSDSNNENNNKPAKSPSKKKEHKKKEQESNSNKQDKISDSDDTKSSSENKEKEKTPTKKKDKKKVKINASESDNENKPSKSSDSEEKKAVKKKEHKKKDHKSNEKSSESEGNKSAPQTPTRKKPRKKKEKHEEDNDKEESDQESESNSENKTNKSIHKTKEKNDDPNNDDVEEYNGNDEEYSAKAWNLYKSHNDSIVVDTFHGLLRSKIRCPNCKSSAVMFDPFVSISLPITTHNQLYQICFVPYDVRLSQMNLTLPIPYNSSKEVFEVSLFTEIGRTCRVVYAQVSETISVNNNNNFSTNNPDSNMIPKSHSMSALSSSSNEFNSQNGNMFVSYSLQYTSVDVVANPSPPFKSTKTYVLEVPDEINYCAIARLAVKVKGLVNSSVKHLNDLYIVEIPNESPTKEEVAQSCKKRFGYLWNNRSEKEIKKDIHKNIKNENFIKEFLACHQLQQLLKGKEIASFKKGDQCLKVKTNTYGHKFPKFKQNPIISSSIASVIINGKFMNEASGFNYQLLFRPNSNVNHISPLPHPHKNMSVDYSNKKKQSLENLLRTFTSPTLLDEDNKWYCPKCKEFVCADKKLDIWSLPKCFIINFKRFAARRNNRGYKKIETNIEFDEIVDFSPFVVGDQSHNNIDDSNKEIIDDNKKMLLYRLYAVIHHNGQLNGGHYTAHSFVESQNKWFYFNDTVVKESTQQAVHQSSAYILFYQRIDDDENDKEKENVNQFSDK